MLCLNRFQLQVHGKMKKETSKNNRKRKKKKKRSNDISTSYEHSNAREPIPTCPTLRPASAYPLADGPPLCAVGAT